MRIARTEDAGSGALPIGSVDVSAVGARARQAEPVIRDLRRQRIVAAVRCVAPNRTEAVHHVDAEHQLAETT